MPTSSRFALRLQPELFGNFVEQIGVATEGFAGPIRRSRSWRGPKPFGNKSSAFATSFTKRSTEPVVCAGDGRERRQGILPLKRRLVLNLLRLCDL